MGHAFYRNGINVTIRWIVLEVSIHKSSTCGADIRNIIGNVTKRDRDYDYDYMIEMITIIGGYIDFGLLQSK